MTEDFEIEALHYLLDELDATRRAAFEDQLARDPGARASLKTCADALGYFAADTAPAEPMTAMDQRVALATILAETGGTVAHPPAAQARVIPWAQYFWPIAAAVLLGLNLLQFERPLGPLPRLAQPEPVAGGRDLSPTAEPAETPSTAPAKAPAAVADAESALEATKEPGSTAVPPIAPSETTRQLEKLRGDFASLQRNHAALRAEYDAALHSLAERVLLDKGPGRLAAMELVDSGAYARGERKGLMEVARGILSEPGVVVADVTPLPGSDPSGRPTEGFGVSTTEPSVAPAAKTPYAWSVFDDKEHQGYLNLYDLPLVAADQSLQLWVKPLDATDYQRVGEVPAEFYGRSGSVRYKLPETTSVPAEILITQEPRNAAAGQPTGPTILRGP